MTVALVSLGGSTWAQAGFLVGAAWLAVVLVAIYRPVRILEYAVGVTAGLDVAQVASVHLCTIACVLYAAAKLSTGTSIRWTAPFAVLATAFPLALTVLIGDLVNSPVTAVQLILLAGSAAILLALADEAAVARMAYGLLAICTVGSAVAIGQKAGIIPYTPFVDSSVTTGRVLGIWREPDWMGMYAGIGLVLSVRLPMRTRILLLVMPILAGALVLSIARAAFAGVLVAGLLSYAVNRFWRAQRKGRARTGYVVALTAVAGLVFIAASPGLRESTVERLGAVAGTHKQDVSLEARKRQNASLRALSDSAPWYGHGLTAAGRVTAFGDIDYGDAEFNVASNWVVGWWVDGKLLAVPLILLLIGAALFGIRGPGGSALLLVLVGSLASNAILTPIAWFALGIVRARPVAEPRLIRWRAAGRGTGRGRVWSRGGSGVDEGDAGVARPPRAGARGSGREVGATAFSLERASQ